MGAAPSKLAVLEQFNQLRIRPDIPETDDIWESLLSAASNSSELTAPEFFTLVTADDIRRIRTGQPENLRSLAKKATERLEGLTRLNNVGVNGTVSNQISNCCRILTRIAPIMYEGSTDPKFRDMLPRIIDVLRSLLLFKGYTIPLDVSSSPYIWCHGIGTSKPVDLATHETANRLEILRALLSIMSSPLYSPDSYALGYFTATTKDPSILYSLLNTALMQCTSELGSRTLCLLVITLTHMSRKKNQVRKFISKLQEPRDLEWLETLLQGLYAFAPNKILSMSLIWEIIQTNKYFTASSRKLAGLAESLCKDLNWEVRNRDDSLKTRLRRLLLLSLTAGSTWCAQAIAPEVFSLVIWSGADLSRPTVELATLVDILWNCSPHLVLTEIEANQFQELCEKVQESNPTVFLVLHTMAETMGPRNPYLKTIGRSESNTEWNAIMFQWDEQKFRWYQGIQWAQVYEAEPRIWSHTNIKLIKIKQPEPIRIELKKIASSWMGGSVNNS